MLITTDGSRAHREDGFTLVELLVAMAAGLVVMGALVMILLTVFDQTQLTTTRVQATRETRDALATIENELHSACVGTGTTQNLAPIQPGSDGNDLIFVSWTGPGINPTPVWHVISYNSGTKMLTDASYAVSGANGAWTPAAQPTSTMTLLQSVTPQPGTPIFQYFTYQPYPIAGSGNDYWTIPDGTNALPDGTIPPETQVTPVPLSAGADGSAAATVEVLVTLVGQADNANLNQPGIDTAADPESDAISLRLTEPPDEAPPTAAASYGPCE